MKFVAYLSSVPPSKKSQHKAELLKRFVSGVQASGDHATLAARPHLVNADVAFIQGWPHATGKQAEHNLFRRKVYDFQKSNNNRLLVVDSNLFNYRGANTYDRYSFDGVFPNTGTYFWDNPDPAHWQSISHNTGIALKDWRQNGKHILVCLQRNGGWSMGTYDIVDWAAKTIAKIQQATDRPIVLRPHPGDKSARQHIGDVGRFGNVKLSRPEATLMDDLQDCWAVVNHNSSPTVGSVIEGYPIFVTDPDRSQAAAVANTDLRLIENPAMPDRQAWVERIAMCHWNHAEVVSGECWQHIKKFV
jgi:hypothetical protein